MIQLTIGIPTWNRYEFLKENVLSIIKAIQKLPLDSIELLVCDNASDDNTQDFMLELSKKYNYISYYRHDCNMGANFNFYTVLNKAKGKYVWLLGDDDLIVEESLSILLKDLELYTPDLIIGATINDSSKKRVYLKDIANKTLTDKNILYKYNAIELAGKMSVLIFAKSIFTSVAYDGLELIEKTKTPWPHLVWFLMALAKNAKLLILPYATNYIVEKNKYNLIQDGILRIELLFIDYANLIQSIKPYFVNDKNLQKALVSRITYGRGIELVKLAACATFLNTYKKTLVNAIFSCKKIPAIQNKLRFLNYYIMLVILPKKLRYIIFKSLAHIAPKSSLYKKFINTMIDMQNIKPQNNNRALFDKEQL